VEQVLGRAATIEPVSFLYLPDWAASNNYGWS
jgi:hypothetical protein